MQKNTLFVAVFALIALASSAFAQKTLDIIIRHFQVTDYGFEELDEGKGANGVCAGTNPNKRNSKATDRNRICFEGDRYMYCDEGGTTLKYGQDDCNDNAANTKRGYCNGPDKLAEWKTGNVRKCKGESGNGQEICWNNDVYVTRGMVQENLKYTPQDCERDGLVEGDPGDPDHIRYRYCARPQKGNDDCYGDRGGVDNWFGDAEKRSLDMVSLNLVNGLYEVNYDYNSSNDFGNGYRDRGYFPLDKYWKEGSKDYDMSKTWGPQSLNVYCPDISIGDQAFRDLYGFNFNDASWKTNCQNWRDKGGPRDPTAAKKTGLNKELHAYAYSVAGSGAFRYKPGSGDIFEFIGDDDMWIFIDGKLVADLGGVHLAAPAKIKIDDLAAQRGGWEDNSVHTLNFFYMDRQSDGSNFKLKFALNDLAPSRFGGPRITEAKTIINSDGSSKTLIWVSTKLDEETVRNIIRDGQYPIIVHKSGQNEAYGYKLEDIKISNDGKVDGSKGYMYEIINGGVCINSDCNTALNSGDSLSFNVTKLDLEADGRFNGSSSIGLKDESFFVKGLNNQPADKLSWAKNATDFAGGGGEVAIPPGPPIKPDFVINPGQPGGGGFGDETVPGGSGGPIDGARYDGGGKFPSIRTVWDPREGKMISIGDIPGAGGDGNRGNDEIHGFGVVGAQIPPQRAGELILTAFPSFSNPNEYEAWVNDPDHRYFGLPPKSASDDEWWGVADPSKQMEIDGRKTGGYVFVKNGFPNESNTKGHVSIAPTRCTTHKIDDEGARVNCLNFSLVASQPFTLAVTVYDQVGNFVTQYRETVSEQEFRNVIQGPNYTDNNKDKLNLTEGCYMPDNNNYGAPTTASAVHEGKVNVNVNIYPFSSNGRRFGNGVYIVKVDRVDIPFINEKRGGEKGGVCASQYGNVMWVTPDFKRYHAEQKFGWMRSSKSPE
ncbi:MAG: fibro-slime domain-containing protein [Candidatus Fibromonas sp.]|jgi:fibro-slime domain-containing protein|nr:fibro-slime domain-containing protein [Candidatus Fibromonas sp.]